MTKIAYIKITNYGRCGTQVLKLFALSALHSDKAYQTLYAAYLIYAELILFFITF